MAIDLDRGVSKRTHPNGMQVCMYKDDPGVFYDVLENELEEDFAAECGFDVETLRKEREKLRKMKEARLKIEKEYASVSGDVIGSFGEYQVICIDEGRNQYDVVKSGDTKAINDKFLSKDQAVEFANSLKKKK